MAVNYKSVTYTLLNELGEEHDERMLGCKCCRFNKGLDLPIPREMSVLETGRYGKEFSISIFKDWTQPNAIAKRFEGTIQKRWMKKNFKQRREVLVKAWPGMSTTHRPDFESFRTNKQVLRARSCHTAAFLWPYINLEDLQQQHLLLLFLKSRSRNLPGAFHVADLEAAHLGDKWTPDSIDGTLGGEMHDCDDYCGDEHTARHCMLFENLHSVARYGKIVDRDHTRLKRTQLKHANHLQTGLLVLEVQKEIYCFLLRCAKLILHDIDPPQFRLAPHLPEPAMPCPVNPGQQSLLLAQSLEAPYRVAQKPDLERLRMMVQGRRESAEDHVWLLREDPSYFMDSLKDWFEHNENHDCGKDRKCTCYMYETGRMVGTAYATFLFWEDINRRLHEMPPIERQMRRANEADVCLAMQDENRWAALSEVLFNLRSIPLDLLFDGLPQSPRLRGRYRWDDGLKMWCLRSGSPEVIQRIDRLFYSLLRRQQQDLHGWQAIVEETQYMMETDTSANEYMDAWVATQFSDLALVSEVTKAMNSLAPFFNEGKGSELALTRQSVDIALENIRSMTRELSLAIPRGCVRVILDGFVPVDRLGFSYPADKRRTKANIEKMQAVEQQLDMSWWMLEEEVSFSTKLSLEKIFTRRLLRPRALYRTPAWREPIQLMTPGATPQKTALSDISSNVSGAGRENASKRFDDTPVKAKVKTRGVPAAEDPRSRTYCGPFEANAPPSHSQEKIRIPKKAHRVFSALLPGRESVVEQRCELTWEELIAAFNAVGLEPEKLYGSVWSFKPRPKDGGLLVNVERSIQFHEPKEVRRGQKIPRPMVRTFGRRLKHAYGWECAEEMFESE